MVPTSSGAGAVLELPSLAGAVAYLRSIQDSYIELGVALNLDDASEAAVAPIREEVAESSLVKRALATQRSDGSWGEHDRAAGRILPTLWMAKALAELGVGAFHPGWDRAAGFLATTAHTDGGVFSISGHRDGVLSCYVGIAASMYGQAGRRDLAEPQVDWILRYQAVGRNGLRLRSDTPQEWEPHLAKRYGGCMAQTTCLVGVVRTGQAMIGWVAAKPAAGELIGSMREAFLERNVIYRSSGGVIPLSVVPAKAESWLMPAWPLDWRIDLIEVLAFLGRSGPPDERMQDAVDRLVSFRLPDGTWPLRRTYRPQYLDLLERRSGRRGSPMITLRAVTALCALGASG